MVNKLIDRCTQLQYTSGGVVLAVPPCHIVKDKVVNSERL
jgi:hypothetical protein